MSIPDAQEAPNPHKSPLAHPLSWVAIAAIVLLLGWVALRNVSSDSSQALSADEPGVSHVHGLGINPADGALIVATHYGSFRIPLSGKVQRIGPSYQDTMGFTVVGPDRFLGSGHPDVAGMQRGEPGRLGLIESVDSGASWSSVSLSGEADFHGIVETGGQVFAWDSGTSRLMVSSDRTSWEIRSTLDLLSFAVDPVNPDYLLAATPTELIASTDGGRSWAPSDGPPLVTMSWDRVTGLWGAEASGALWHLEDRTWSRAGDLDRTPQALLAAPDALYAAVSDADEVTGIYTSTDGGRSWALRYRDPG